MKSLVIRSRSASLTATLFVFFSLQGCSNVEASDGELANAASESRSLSPATAGIEMQLPEAVVELERVTSRIAGDRRVVDREAMSVDGLGQVLHTTQRAGQQKTIRAVTPNIATFDGLDMSALYSFAEKMQDAQTIEQLGKLSNRGTICYSAGSTYVETFLKIRKYNPERVVYVLTRQVRCNYSVNLGDADEISEGTYSPGVLTIDLEAKMQALFARYGND